MDTRELRDWLHAVFECEASRDQAGDETLPDHLTERVERILSYQDAGVFTNLDGLVIDMEDGSQYQVTIVQSRHAPKERFLWKRGDIELETPR